MKRKSLFFLCLMALCAVEPVWGQFHTVEKKMQTIKIYSSDESPEQEIFKYEKQIPSSTVGKDTLINYQIASLSSLQKERLMFSVPLEHDTLIVTSAYGYRRDPFTGKTKFHDGTDFRTYSENVFAMMPGRIRKIGYKKSLGNFIEIAHGDFTVLYGHLYTVKGRKGDSVNAGQSVGITGSTGRSTGEHLHISVKYKGKSINPYPFVLYITAHVNQLREAILKEEHKKTVSNVNKPNHR